MSKYCLLAVSFFGALFLCETSFAARIYKSIDADGNVTYSSVPPREAVSIEKISVPSNYGVNDDAVTNIQAIKQTADQFEEERKQREQERKAAQKERDKAEAEAAKQEAKPPEKEIRYVPVYPDYYFPGRPPHPHPKPKPRYPQPQPAPHPLPRGPAQ